MAHEKYWKKSSFERLLGSFGDFYALPFPVKVVIFNVYKAG